MSSAQFLYAILAGLLPSLIWLVFWTREDKHPEPRTLLAGCFLGGMLSVVAAYYAEQYLAGLVTTENLRYVLWAGAEEIVKFIAVAAIALHTLSNDEPIDAMIYCITVALGFAALENVIFLMNWLQNGEIVRSIVNGDLRFIGATLVHVVSSGLIGFSLAITFYRHSAAKILGVILSLAAAIAVHASFNIAVNSVQPTQTLGVFGWVWAAVVVMIVLFEEAKAVRPKLL